MMYTVFMLALIALAMGAMVILKAKKNKELGTGGVKFFGYVISILAILMLLFSGYFVTKHACMTYSKMSCKTMPTHVKRMMKR